MKDSDPLREKIKRTRERALEILRELDEEELKLDRAEAKESPETQNDSPMEGWQDKGDSRKA